MWECRKCSKPVFFAERKQSLGFDWHPNCLRCEECGKRLNPGQHAEHKGLPFCHHPCYGALFGPHLFGHGTRNECHTSFGKVENRNGQVKRSHLESQLKIYNGFYDGKPGELKSREVNGRLILEGVLRIYWGVQNTIHLKEEDDSRMIATRRRSCVESRMNASYGSESDTDDPLWRDESPNAEWNRRTWKSRPPGGGGSNEGCTTPDASRGREEPLMNSNLATPTTNTIPTNPNHQNCREGDNGTPKNENCREGDNEISKNASHHTNGDVGFISHDSEGAASPSNTVNNNHNHSNNCGGIERQERIVSNRMGSTAIRRRPGRRMEKSKLKRRCSINGHFYLRETSSFTPPYASGCSIWITSKTTAEEVLNMLLEKYKVEMSTSNFALFIVKDNGERKRIKEDESPLVTRVMLGPHENVAKVFIMDAQRTHEVSHEVAQFLNLSLAECRAILSQFEQEETRHIKAIRMKYEKMKLFIQNRLNSSTTEIIFPETKNTPNVC